MKHILTLCTGNICRSPLAEALLARELPDHIIWSAGLGALVGNRADPLSVAVAAAHGLNIEAHRAQQVTRWMCQQADLILVMEPAKARGAGRQAHYRDRPRHDALHDDAGRCGGPGVVCV